MFIKYTERGERPHREGYWHDVVGRYGPAPLLLQSSAEAAASLQDLRAQVTDAGQATRAVSLWDELRVWDPGD